MTPASEGGPVSLRRLVAHWAAREPRSPALWGAGAPPLTYSALLAQIDAVGQVLLAEGIGASDRVAVVLPNGPLMAACFLGIGAHATCAPLNPAYQAGELEFYLTDLEAKGVVVAGNADHPVRSAARKLGVRVLEIVPDGDQAGRFQFHGAPAPSSPVGDAPQDDAPALVLHTSGTTSRPKQVPLSHRNLCASATHIARTLRLHPADRCLNVMPLFHIHGLVGALLSSLHAGASVVCGDGFHAETFAKDLADFRPTWYSAVPTIHQSIVALARSNPAIASGGPLRLIRSSSSALPPTVMAELEEIFGVPVLESYGMTEAAHQMASNPPPPAARKPGSVGPPAGPEMAIMDEAGNLLPTGAEGEIVIRGPNVTLGYVNNPDANRSAFTDGWFRTGDLGRRDDDGYYFLTGRKKEMINRGGENISPREIDEALLQHPAVAQAVAFAVSHPRLGEDVSAAVVLRNEHNVSEADLRRFVADRLADFKVPSQIVMLDAIPKGPTGKVQRIGLHEKLADRLQRPFAPPTSPDEAALVELWAVILALDSIGVDDNFFAMGGDSILATQVISRLNAQHGLKIPLTMLFQAPTVRQFAVELDSLRSQGVVAGTRSALPPLRSARASRGGLANPPAPTADARRETTSAHANQLDLSIYFFSADGSTQQPSKYALLRQCAQFADQNGFSAVWVPERHFSRFGGLYPNPSVLGAALAAWTSRIEIRAGSVVLPLQDPLRVAEEWSVVDNLSNGRVAIACASGWHPNDFVLAPANYADRRRIMLERIETIRALWRGDAIRRPNGLGEEIEVRILPRPIRPALPIWLAAHSDETFLAAGRLDANVVTNIWKVDLDEVARQVELYRQARREHGAAGDGKVTLMIHTFLADTNEEVLERVGRSYGEYLQAFLELRDDQARGSKRAFDLPETGRAELVAHATRELFDSRGLLGTPDRCAEILERLRQGGIDEVACLVDFGVETDGVLRSLELLAKARKAFQGA